MLRVALNCISFHRQKAHVPVFQMFDGWVLKGEKFPSSQDHPLATHQRYTDYCSSTATGASSRSSQNVAMVFYRIHGANSGFTLTVKKLHNPFRKSDVLKPEFISWKIKINMHQGLCQRKIYTDLMCLAEAGGCVHACVCFLDICARPSINQGRERQQQIEWEACTCFPAAWQTLC